MAQNSRITRQAWGTSVTVQFGKSPRVRPVKFAASSNPLRKACKRNELAANVGQRERGKVTVSGTLAGNAS